MKIEKDFTDYHRLYFICPFKGYHHVVTVSQSKEYDKWYKQQSWGKPTINWSAIGATDIETTDLFIQGLNEAIKLAKELENDMPNL